MKIETDRAKLLDAYFKTQKPEKYNWVRVEIAGKITNLPAYRVPLKHLLFNIRNGRFAAELLEKEEQLKRKLNPTVELDAKIIQKLLLEQSESETEGLKADIREHGQIDAGIITFDGAVINANRRMAILRTLFEETRENRFDYLIAARLPSQVDQKDLWRMEAGLQFAKDFRLEYGPINELLKLQEGILQGLTPADISKSLQGRYTPKKVEEKIAILELINSYLKGISKPGEYHLIIGHVEKFNSLQANVIAPLRRKGKDDSEIADIVSAAFSLIHKAPDVSHWGIRNLRYIALNEKAVKELSPIIEGKASKEAIRDAYDAAQDIVEDTKKKDEPERLVGRALTALNSISSGSRLLAQPKVKKMLNDLIVQAQLLLKVK